MRKSIIFLFLLLSVLSLFVSCKEEVGTTALKLILKSDSTTRLITNQSVDISYFKVTGTGPENGDNTPQEIDVTVTMPQTSLTLQGLVIGNWTFKVTAYNAENTPLMEGSTTIYVTSRPSPVVIDVNTPVGKGNISLTLSWDAPQITNPVLKIYRRGPSMDTPETNTEEPVLDTTSCTATYNVSNLVSGNYVLRIELFDGDSFLGGKVETVKVFKDQITTGEISIVYDAAQALKDTGLILQTVYGKPVQGLITPTGRNDHILYANEEAVLQFSVSSSATIKDEDYTVEWYYDGILQNAGTTQLSSNISTFTFTPYIGVHIVDVVCYDKNYASVGSAEWSFTSVAKGPKGSLFVHREVNNGENGLSLDNNTLIGAIPDSRFLVLSQNDKRLQVCDLDNNGVKVLSSLDNSYFSYAKHIFSDYRMNAFCVIDNQQDGSQEQQNFTLFMYSSDTSVPMIDVVRNSESEVMRINHHGNMEDFPVTNINSGPFSITGDKTGFLFLPETVETVGTITTFKFSANEMIDKEHIVARANTKGDLSKSFSIGTDRFFYTLPGYSAIATMEFDTTKGKFKDKDTAKEIPIRFIAEYIYAISDTEFAVSNGTSQTCIYQLQANGWAVTSIVYHPTAKICISEDGYVYMLDKVNSTIYSYSLSNTGSLTELNRVSAENLSDIAYSSGNLLASTTDGRLLFCKVVAE